LTFKKAPFSIRIAVIFLVGLTVIAYGMRQRHDRFAISLKVKDFDDQEKIIGKVAIVIDDLGYSLKNLDQIYNIKEPLTLSILPNLPYSRSIALEAAGENCEVILHLPLESSQESAPMEEGTIYTNMTEEDVRQKINKAIDSISTVKGVSNHMGSKATQDKPFMQIVFSELEEKGLYFLDSLVTNRSICEGLAEKSGIRFAKRDVYLDNLDEPAYIKNQFDLLLKQAKKKGFAIGIGHDKEATIEMLREMMPELEKTGIEFVFVSELVR